MAVTLQGSTPNDLQAATSNPDTAPDEVRAALAKAAGVLAKHLGGSVSIHATAYACVEDDDTLTVTVSRVPKT